MKLKTLFVAALLCALAPVVSALPRYAAYHDGSISAAPSMLWPNPAPPTEAEYNARGFYRVVDTMPANPAPEGYHYEPRGWELASNEIRRVYAVVQDAPPPPKVYQTADVIEALMAHEVWPQCRAWIEERGLLDLVFTTPSFEDDWPNFVAAKQGLQQLLDWTDEQVAELLAEASGSVESPEGSEQ